MAAGPVPPPVSWAQRNDSIFLSIDVECVDIDYKVTEKTFSFKGKNRSNPSINYELTLNFFEEVLPEKVNVKNIGRVIEFTIDKKKSDPASWPSLTAEKAKLPFLKTNFSKWCDDSDDEDYKEDPFMLKKDDLKMGDKNPLFDDLGDDEDEDNDSDDEIPGLYDVDAPEEETPAAAAAAEAK